MRNVWLRFLKLSGRSALLLTVLSACSTATPSATTQSDIVVPSTVVGLPQSTVPSTTPETTAVTGVVPDLDQEGLAAPIWDDHDYGEPTFAASLGDIAATGAEWVTLVPTWYQSDPESSALFAERPGRTSTDEALVVAIDGAQALGLQVMLKPHLDLVDGGYRGMIEPASVEEWFDSYREVLLGYARLAQMHDVAQLVVGTELAGVSGETERWRDLIADVRQEFSGVVTYAANHDEFISVEFWDDLDLIGVDAYFPLADQPTTDGDQLITAWGPIVDELGRIAAEFDLRIVFTEIGYPSQEGAVVEPFNPFASTVPSNAEQEVALESMLSAVDGQPWFAGFHWWMWLTGESPEERALGYMPQGKPVEAILERRWAEP